MLRPEFFDIFGVAVFAFITIVALWALPGKGPLPFRMALILLLIGIAGLIVDGAILYVFYFR